GHAKHDPVCHADREEIRADHRDHRGVDDAGGDHRHWDFAGTVGAQSRKSHRRREEIRVSRALPFGHNAIMIRMTRQDRHNWAGVAILSVVLHALLFTYHAAAPTNLALSVGLSGEIL